MLIFGCLALALLLLWWYSLWSPRALLDIRSTRPLLLGHRGVRGSQPDNSLAAFQDAFAAGLDGIECDVQLSRDGALVLMHDTELLDSQGLDGQGQHTPVRTLTRHQLQQRDANIITLETLFDLAQQYPHTLLNVELKLPFDLTSWRYQLWGSRQLEQRVASCVSGYGLQGRVLISSFHPWTLVRMRLAAPGLRVALLGYNIPWWLAGLLHVDAIHPHHSKLDAALFQRAKRIGLMVNSWTVNDDAEVKRLAALPVDGLVADNPEALKQAAQAVLASQQS
jgi:glycerophosphoryl diester phosphodiesterase